MTFSKNIRRARKPITYHGRTGRPVVHRTKDGRKYIMVRDKGGGTKRLYQCSKYTENGSVKRLKVV